MFRGTEKWQWATVNIANGLKYFKKQVNNMRKWVKPLETTGRFEQEVDNKESVQKSCYREKLTKYFL